MITIAYQDTLCSHQLPPKASGANKRAAVRLECLEAHIKDGMSSATLTRISGPLRERE